MFNYDDLVVKYSDSFIRVLIPQEKVDRIKTLTEIIISKKLSEAHHQVDNSKEFKRFFTGLMGEAAVEQILSLNIIEWTAGNSNRYNHPDISEYNIGIKTVERNKFPIIFKHNTYDQIICVLSDKIPNLVFVCGLASVPVLNTYQSDELILSPQLRARGVKTGFYGFQYLKPFSTKEELEHLLENK